jgi:AMP nucleosidase
MEPEGIKTSKTDREVNKTYVDLHIEIGIATMETLLESEENVKHLRY